jgi:hypothetical protein
MPRSRYLGFAAPDRTTERLGVLTGRRLSNIAQFIVSLVSVAHGRSGLPGQFGKRKENHHSWLVPDQCAQTAPIARLYSSRRIFSATMPSLI